MLYPIQNEIRNQFDLSGIWDFRIDPEETGEANGWFNGLENPRPIAVPGSWNEQYADLFNYFGLSWYLKRTYIPRGWEGQRVFLRAGSADYAGAVYVNGTKLGGHEGPHLPFAFEITGLIRWTEENVIAICVENHLEPTRVPPGGSTEDIGISGGYPTVTYDFFPFAGLHRPVVLYSVPQTFICDVTVVTGINGSDGRVKVSARINVGEAQGQIRIAGPGQSVESSIVFDHGEAETTLTVPSARFWSPEDPFLYDLTITAGEDRYTLKIGIRTIEVKGRQILLNGSPIQLNGFGRHEDFYASGKGLNLPLLIKDYALMRWVGARSYRTSHYPYSEEEMQLADREGFLIIDESPAVGLSFDNEANMAERLRICLQEIEEMIARDKNHPSVILWSVANEPVPNDLPARVRGIEVEDPMAGPSREFLETLLRLARRLDPTRPVTFAAVMGAPYDWMRECDVISLNRYWGWYVLGGQLEKGFETLDRELDEIWTEFGRPVILTEFGADTIPGMHGQPALMWTEEYQADFIRGCLEVAARKDFIAGMQVWNFADFAAVQSPGRVGGMNMKGVFTRARQPKLAAHVLREFWTDNSDPKQPE